MTKPVLYRATKSLTSKVEYSLSLLRKSEKLALRFNDYGYHLAFSGGKDSQVVYELCKMSGVKFKAFFYKTSLDARAVLRFIREKYPDVTWIKPKKTMFQMILMKGALPSRTIRYCCDILKERRGFSAVVLTGIRAAESYRRATKRKEYEVGCKRGKEDVILNPIYSWDERDVYQFLLNRNIELCEVYKYFKRVGCVGCPMNDYSQRKAFALYPNFKKAYINTVRKAMIIHGTYSDFKDAEEVIEWWISGMTKKQWVANKNQCTIKWE